MHKTNTPGTVKLFLNVGLPLIFCCASVQADSAPGQFGMGATMSNRTMQFEGADTELRINPHLQYRGERFNILGDTLGYNFSNHQSLRMEVIGKLENRGYDKDHLDIFAGMADRDPSFEVGGRLALRTEWGMFSIDATTDASRTHEGQTVDVRFGPDIYQQQWQGQRDVSLSMLAGAKWESDEVVDYYYGVRDSEATANRAAYQGEAAITPYAGLSALMNISPRLTLEGTVIYSKRPDEIADSPLIEDDQAVTANIGLTYWFQ